MADLFKHVLVGTDLSGSERGTYPWAALFADRCDARLTVLHADEVDKSTLDVIAGFEDFIGMLSSLRGKRVEECKQDFESLQVDADLVVRQGAAKRVIAGYAEDEGVDLIVVGKHTLSDGTTKPLGSNLSRVLHHTRLPVLVIPVFDDDDDHKAMEMPVIKRVLTPTDLGPVSREAVLFAARMTLHLYNDVELTVGHAVDWPTTGPIGLPSTALELLTEDAESHLAQLLSDIGEPNALTIKTQVEAGRAVDVLLKMADDIDADLIIVPSSGKGAFSRFLLGSTTDRLIKQTTRPVLMLPPSFLMPADDEE